MYVCMYVSMYAWVDGKMNGYMHSYVYPSAFTCLCAMNNTIHHHLKNKCPVKSKSLCN